MWMKNEKWDNLCLEPSGTLFGKVIHEVQLVLLEVVRSHWQPEAVDSLSSTKEKHSERKTQ